MTTPVPLPVAQWADVAIVGAGLCGLALARVLTARGLRVQVLEARSRLGGRVLTAHCEATDQHLDLGPTWYWPETEPRIVALLAELDLSSFNQHDPGDALWLTDPSRAPERHLHAGGVHAGARRIQGGAARLVEALASALPPDTVRLDAEVKSLRDRGSCIEISLQTSDEQAEFSIRDHGAGAPDYALPQIFDRFYSLPRPATGRKSTGLGLALVREVARLHGGEASFENHPEGGGLARIRLPKH